MAKQPFPKPNLAAFGSLPAVAVLGSLGRWERPSSLVQERCQTIPATATAAEPKSPCKYRPSRYQADFGVAPPRPARPCNPGSSLAAARQQLTAPRRPALSCASRSECSVSIVRPDTVVDITRSKASSSSQNWPGSTQHAGHTTARQSSQQVTTVMLERTLTRHEQNRASPTSLESRRPGLVVDGAGIRTGCPGSISSPAMISGGAALEPQPRTWLETEMCPPRL